MLSSVFDTDFQIQCIVHKINGKILTAQGALLLEGFNADIASGIIHIGLIFLVNLYSDSHKNFNIRAKVHL